MVDPAHAGQRAQFYDQIHDFWSDLYGKEYALYDLYSVDPALIKTAREATTAVARVLTEIANQLQRLPDEQWQIILSSLGYPTITIPWLRQFTLPWPSVIARADWAWTPDGLKLLEWNADTPSFIKELFDVNGQVCAHFKHADPNTGQAEHLSTMLGQAVRTAATWLDVRDPYVVISGYPDDPEDVSTNRYLAELLAAQGFKASCIPLRDLRVDIDGIYDGADRRIDVWFRPGYPLEFLAEELDPETGVSLGEAVYQLVRAKKVALINPYSAFLLQNKMLQAFAWAARDSAWLSDASKASIEQYFLPSYEDPAPLIESQMSYVRKPLFGREGSGVQICHDTEEAQNDHETIDEPLLYQQFVDLPKHTVRTVHGEEDVYLLLGCFCIAGQGSAVGFRAGGLITDNQSYYLPIGLKG